VVALEILIVVVGLFLGLQLDGWNDERKDRLTEREYLERLSRNIARDAETLAAAMESVQQHAEEAVYAMDALDNPAMVADEPCRFVEAVWHASSSGYPLLYRHTFDEIVSSGDLKLLRNDELKDQLGQYYTAHESGGQWMDAMRQVNLDYMAAFAGVLTRAEIDALQEFETGGECGIDADGALAVRERFLDREGLAEWLPRLEIRQSFILGRLRESSVANGRLQALLAEELGRQ